MCLFNKKNKRQKGTDVKRKVHKNSPEVRKAKAYLEDLYPSFVGRNSSIAHLCGRNPFTYFGSTQNGEYTRYLFLEGSDERIIYVVLSDEECEKIINLFTEKAKEKIKNYEEFVYRGSLKGMFIGEEPKHRFYCERNNTLAFMSEDGEIDFPLILESEDMD